MVHQLDEQIREYLLQQERIDQARRPTERIDEPVRQERRKWERRLGYFALAGVAVVVFALNEYFPNKPGQVVLIVLGGGVLAFLGA
jgi:ferric-dicitrate binding protein FerR (iron transport regulator)